MIVFDCPQCQRPLATCPGTAGRWTTCLHCDRTVLVPSASDTTADEPGLVHAPEQDLESQTLGLLAGIETGFKRMIVGTVRFTVVKLPCWLRTVLENCFAWLIPVLGSIVRVAVRVARVAAVGTIWLALVVGPLVVSFLWRPAPDTDLRGWTALWLVIGLSGSIWGLTRRSHHPNEAWPRRVEPGEAVREEACHEDGAGNTDAQSIGHSSGADRNPQPEEDEPADADGTRSIRDGRPAVRRTPPAEDEPTGRWGRAAR